MKYPIIILLLAVLVLDCSTVRFAAPANKNIEMLSEADPATYKTTTHAFYFLWGLIPISNNSTDKIILDKGLKNARAKSYYGIVDILVEFFTAGIISTYSIQIEGNVE